MHCQIHDHVLTMRCDRAYGLRIGSVWTKHADMDDRSREPNYDAPDDPRPNDKFASRWIFYSIIAGLFFGMLVAIYYYTQYNDPEEHPVIEQPVGEQTE